MKTKLIYAMLFGFFGISGLFAQTVTNVRAANSDISDNLDLQAVASIFGDSRDLEDFEQRLNDPSMMISNLDLNGDNRVDYLRVVELTENGTHVIVLQAVLGPDTYQDVATLELERDRYNNVTVQIVGDPYIYGPSYIYQPVYVTRPVIFGLFWVSSYRPYYSPWYWDYYPTYYNYWAPCSPMRYHNHVHVYINYRNTYNYVNVRYSTRAAAIYSPRRANAYEREYPGRSFAVRNNNARNFYDLQQTRGNIAGGRTNNVRSYNNGGTRNSFDNNGGRTYPNGGGRENGIRNTNQGTTGTRSNSYGNGDNNYSNTTPRSNNYGTPRSNNSYTPRNNSNYTPSRTNNNTTQAPGNYSTPRPNVVRSGADGNQVRQYGTPTRSAQNNMNNGQNSTMVNPRSNFTPAVRSNPGNSMQQAPQVRNNTAPARQNSMPAATRSNGNGGGRNGRN